MSTKKRWQKRKAKSNGLGEGFETVEWRYERSRENDV